MQEVREQVRQKYAAAIQRTQSCCGNTGSSCNPVTSNLYESTELGGLSEDLVASSFGCGNPTALASLHAGEVVLDLGSGAGLDVLLSAKRVGPYGKAYGLDMTDEMLSVARANQHQAGISNAEFVKGHIENIPLPDNFIDVIVSNCVINLSGDKDQVLREAYRVLKPGGRFAVSDIVILHALPASVQKNMAAWAGCVAGALEKQDYLRKLAAAGFIEIEIVTTRTYDFTDERAGQFLPDLTLEERQALNGAMISAFIRAKKTAATLVAGTDYILRQATATDLAVIHHILVTNGLPTADADEQLTTFFVADTAAGIAGVIGIEQASDSVLLRSLAVANDRRKQGIGTALVEQALQHSRQIGAKTAYLLTNTAESFAARWGFDQIPREAIPTELLQNSSLATLCPTTSICMKVFITA